MTYSYGDDGDSNYNPDESRDDYGLTAEEREEQKEMMRELIEEQDEYGDDY